MENIHNREFTLSEAYDHVKVTARPKPIAAVETAGRLVTIGHLEAVSEGDVSAEIMLFREDDAFSCDATIDLPRGLFAGDDDPFQKLADNLMSYEIAGQLNPNLCVAPSSNRGVFMAIERIVNNSAESPTPQSVLVHPQQPSNLALSTFGQQAFSYEGDLTPSELVLDIGYLVARIVNFVQPDKGTRPYGQLEIAIPEDEPPSQTCSQETNHSTDAFGNLGGLDDAIRQLKDIADDILNPELLEECGVPRPGAVLLQGPPGVGKTKMVEGLAGYMGADLETVMCSDILDMWVGRPVEKLKSLFTSIDAKSSKPRIIFFDEFGGLFRNNASGNSGVAASLISELKNILSSAAQKYPKLLIVAADNSIDGIDPALLRAGRMDTIVKVGMPDESGRASIFGNYLSRYALHFEYVTLERYLADGPALQNPISETDLAKQSDGFSGADIESVIQGIMRKRLHYRRKTGEHAEPCTQAELEAAITNYRLSRPSDI